MSSVRTFDFPIHASEQSFARVLAASLPVAAIFWSNRLNPDIDGELKSQARALAGKLLIAKINAAENPELVHRFSIATTPTLITFREGRELARAENISATSVREQLDYVLGVDRQPRAAAKEKPAPSARADGGAKPLTVTDQTFAREVMQSPLPVVVDFWAAWCGPCRMIAPSLEKIAADYAGRVRVAKLNVDENPRSAAQYEARAIPMLLLVKNGRIVDRLVGALPEPQLRAHVERLLRAA